MPKRYPWRVFLYLIWRLLSSATLPCFLGSAFLLFYHREMRILFETGYFLQHKNADKATVYQCLWLPYYTIPRIIRELQLINLHQNVTKNYTIPRIIRELQRHRAAPPIRNHYTIPRIIRELQLVKCLLNILFHYTIPRIIRELQLYWPLL